MNRRKSGIASVILLSLFSLTATAFIIFVVYLVLTPVQNAFFNQISSYINVNSKQVGATGVSAINNIIASSVTQWSIMFTIAIIGTLATIWLVVWRDEPVEDQRNFEY